MKNGKIVQIIGPVIDVAFEDGELPMIKDALKVENAGRTLVMEVAQHVGNNTVRCIMLASSDGLSKGMEVCPTGAPISVPVGNQTLGRMFNVLGQAIDGGEQVKGEEAVVNPQAAASLRSRAQLWKFWKRGSRLSICWRPMLKAERSGCLAAQALGRQF